MPLIKPRTRGKQLVKHRTRLDCENNETLFAYAKFIGEPTEYVMNQLVESVLARDKDFHTWRAEHPGSQVPKPGGRRNGPNRPFGHASPAPVQPVPVAAGSER